MDFVKRYFPYVEKLMPTIKFLRDTLSFGDAVIRKLCAFKDVSIKGELYSREFNQHFRADKTICSLKEDKDGNFNLNIDGVSHVSWFRRKKDEFMQALGMPTRKQNGVLRYNSHFLRITNALKSLVIRIVFCVKCCFCQYNILKMSKVVPFSIIICQP